MKSWRHGDIVVRNPAMEARARRRYMPSLWDMFAFGLVLSVLLLVYEGARPAFGPLAALQQHPVELAPENLPEYALRTILRMLVALVVSLAFSLGYGALAAKSRRAEQVLIPLLDTLQSVPILGFISFTVVGFMALFPGLILGAELAAIFAIFTSQAWNMTFSFYQSLKTVPRDLQEAARSLRLSGWQRFWRLEVPFAIPGLVWNTMLSMSGSWFFVVAAEAITVGHTAISLPGVGSYVALAIQQRDLSAIGWAVAMMLVVILLYDQLLFRPLVAWSDKFRLESAPGAQIPHSWLLVWLRRSRWLRIAVAPADALRRILLRGPHPPRLAAVPAVRRQTATGLWLARVWPLMVALVSGLMLWHAATFVARGADWTDVGAVILLGCYTLLRVLLLTGIAVLIWLPLGVWVGLRPRVAERLQPVAQFLAAFPANLLFPFAVAGIVHWRLAPDVWLSPLMILGAQWYVLFNMIAGASVFPGDLQEAAASFHLRGWLWWRKGLLPGMLPYAVTGAITASGGAWNASIVAEVVSWGDTTLRAHGLGAYITEATTAGNFPHIVLGLVVMTALVLVLNHVLWQPLYRLVQNRAQIA